MEKRYSDFMLEISADELYHGLLAYGLFSEKLPPIFTGEPFYQYCMQKTDAFPDTPHSYIYYENIRNTNLPRLLGIPNPMAYQLQCACLRDNWDKIQNYFVAKTATQTYKKSRIHIRKMHDEHVLFKMNYSNWRIDGSPEPDISFGKRYVVKADISSCFPSIYTHALSWALVTKAVSKQHKNDHDEWYNQLDFYTRNTNHEETHGLIIGPHISNLLSEVILSAVDEKLHDWDYVRAIDDFTCYTDTFEEAQRFLIDLGAALREFDLSINHKKTEIAELPLAATEFWERKLNSIDLTTSFGKTTYIQVRSFLDSAVELMYANKGNSAILNYAIKILAGKNLTNNAQEYTAKTVLSYAFLYPYLIPLLGKYVFDKYCTKCQTHSCIKAFSERIYSDGMKIHSSERASYALYYAMQYSFPIDSFDVEAVIDSEDCILLLLTFLYCKKNNRKTDMKRLKDFAVILSKDDDSFDSFWLLIYEVLPQNDLHNEWKPMKKAKVTFLKALETR